MSEALKPCPFCGERYPTVFIRITKDDVWRDMYAVTCDYIEGGCGTSSRLCNSREDAIEAWNRRADDGHKNED